MINSSFVSQSNVALPGALQWLCIVAVLFMLSACGGIVGGGGEEDTTANAPADSGGTTPADPDPTADPDPNIDPPVMVTDVDLFEQTLFPVLRDQANFCVGCHGVAQIPTFALEDVTAAYNVLISQQKVNLNDPMLSRVYQRPAIDRHICGGAATCDVVAADILAAIDAWVLAAAQLAAPAPDPNAPPAAVAATSAKTNFAAALDGGVVRADANVIAMFTFTEGAGNVAMDSSGVGAPIALQLSGTEWVEGGGLRNVSGKAQASLADSLKLFDMITPNAAYTVEAWLIADNTAQDGPARAVSYSIDTAQRNFTLGQNSIYYQLRNRSLGTGTNGTPALEPLVSQVATELQHVVATFDEATGRKVYMNGQLAAEENAADTLDWTDDQIFVLGNEVTDNRLWQGVFKMVAIHNQALSGAEVRQNFDAGAGNILTLRFDVASVVGAPAYIDMQAIQIDPAAYVFAQPVFVSDMTGIRVKNIRIAVNDAIPVAAQTFRVVDTTVLQSGVMLSPLAAVIPVAQGPDMDQFHLEFELLGNSVGTTEAIAPALPPAPLPDVMEPDLGIRTFSQINDTMSILTGIDANRTAVSDSYSELRGSLPATSDILSFAAAQQIAIQRLATSYCGEIVNNTTRCESFFGQCQIDGNAKDQVAGILYDKLIGANLANQPDSAGVITEIVRMIDDLGCANGCVAAEAETVLNATCAAVLSSSAVTIN